MIGDYVNIERLINLISSQILIDASKFRYLKMDRLSMLVIQNQIITDFHVNRPKLLYKLAMR